MKTVRPSNRRDKPYPACPQSTYPDHQPQLLLLHCKTPSAKLSRDY